MAERYRREIEDILDKLEEAPAHSPKAKEGGRRLRAFGLLGRVLGGGSGLLSPGRVMLAALALLLVALLLKASMPGAFVPFLMWGAVIVFIFGYALFFINASEPIEKRWRAAVVEGPPSFRSRLRRWLRGRR
ncbi:MAG: hypothetical protein HYU30_05920 [Chloroflexi bacterium]|nr:hypothetical protein [Chloroflexota bacterium]MBI4197564.1 hypothetical protein [Chloroflexota bacterium]